jgi:hypothetical protein
MRLETEGVWGDLEIIFWGILEKCGRQSRFDLKQVVPGLGDFCNQVSKSII